MAYWHPEKYDAICQRNFSINGHEEAFEFLPMYIKESITDVTLIMQKPVFEFANGFVLNQECITVDEKLTWRSVMSLGDFIFFDIPDYQFKDLFPSCRRFSDVLGAFSLIPTSDTESWVKALKNARRRTWKTSEEVLSSNKFQKVFDKALSQAMEMNNKDIPMLIPDIPEEFMQSKMMDKIKYTIKYIFGVDVTSYKYKFGYIVHENTQKPITFNNIEDLNIYLQSKLKNYELKLEKEKEQVEKEEIWDAQRQGANKQEDEPKGQKAKKGSSSGRNRK